MGAFMTKVFAGEPTFLHPVLRPLERLCYAACGFVARLDGDATIRDLIGPHVLHVYV